MDQEKNSHINSISESHLSQDSQLKDKYPLSVKYGHEVAVIRQKLGSLEEIRQSLNLSRRKMAQLLMVDPSAWTRWTRQKDSAPPHIFRALQWYLALIEKKPEWHPQNSFNKEKIILIQDEKLNLLREDLEYQIAYLKNENNRLEKQVLEKMKFLEKNHLNFDSRFIHWTMRFFLPIVILINFLMLLLFIIKN